MALSNTTLAANITATDLVIPVASATGMTAGRHLRIDNELVGAIVSAIGTSISVRGRGDGGTSAKAHNLSAPVTVGDATDFPVISEGRDSQVPAVLPGQVYMKVDGAVPLPDKDTVVFITKASAAALTLAVPTAAMDGIKLRFIGLTDYAHVVTVATAFLDGTSGGNTIMTSAAYAGASVELIASKGLWVLISGGTNSGPWVLT